MSPASGAEGAGTSPSVAAQGMHALRGAALTFVDDPFRVPAGAALRHESDALVVVQDGRIAAFGPAARLQPALPPGIPVLHHANALIVPGFVDAHVHYAQLPIIGATGHGLLDWLAECTYRVEEEYADPVFAALTAEVFLDECLRHGITTPAVYATVHAGSAESFFAAAEARGMRAIAGKMMMDRNAPPGLLDTPQRAYDDSKALIGRWHARGRLLYAVSPRFAPCCSPEELAGAGALLDEHPGVFLQTHLAETPEEVAWVRELFPDAPDYLAVYERFGLVRPRSVLGHAIHVDEPAWARLHAAGAAVAHCPTSNGFLGSGHFQLGRAQDPRRPVPVALGTDVGGGTSLSMLATMHEAYKTARQSGFPLTATQAFWLATRGGARALGLDGTIGALVPGGEADLVVLDLAPTPLIAYRMQFCASIEDVLAVLMVLGDDRAVRATYVAGARVHARADGP
jgi:guanine deaminase